ncbi:2-C-methyl-D-erythritol 4-phosphate cytidylyltransferase [Acinetobacter calcoaceticus]|uniref:2-C-methyl-D-erythritol 4-phosphate cytidylyltransferase n=1 Tax=Acinetobacter calcoaceticus TaxID=471 RepID=A0A4R1XN46_ACICA|nr:2-C-methyl-D-erythritol 4-phosphate cytidylyltransferase [Acinetobacter calcoaceticus]
MQEPMKMMNQYPNSPKLWAVIPAAGSGRRFSATDLKQYQVILGQTVLEHSVQALNHLPLAGYVLALGAEDDFAATLQLSTRSLAHFCLGGAERVDSVLNALNYLMKMADPEDWVLVHDAARPCVAPLNLDGLLHTAIDTAHSAILATPVRDTLKHVGADHAITHTVSREQLWQAQTPQISKLGLLKHALETALADGVSVTDEASALEYISAPVQVVLGRSDNIKITYPEDLTLAELILQSRK